MKQCDNAHRNACKDYPHITAQCIYRVATIPTSRVTEQVREEVSPAVGVPPGGEISTLGGGAEEWME